jgi:hypothetical protein
MGRPPQLRNRRVLKLLAGDAFFDNPRYALLHFFGALFPEVCIVFDANMNGYLTFLKNVIYNKIIIAIRLLVVYNNAPGHVLKQRNISKQIALFTKTSRRKANATIRT